MPSRRIVAVGLILCVVAGLIWWFNRSKTTSTGLEENLPGSNNQNSFNNSAELQSFSISPTTTTTITDTLLQKRELASFDWSKGPKPYTASSLKIISDTDVSLKNYGLSIAKILKPLSVQRDNETEILIEAFDSGNNQNLVKIKSAQTTFDNLHDKLLALPVPASATDRHLAVLNGAQNNAWLLKNMGQLSFQPVLALESGRVYLEESKDFFLNVGLLGKLFDEKKIVFSPDEKITVYVNVE